MPRQDPGYPKDVTAQLLVGVIFAESASKHYGGGENPDEKRAIGTTFFNAVFYAKTKVVAGKKCYNGSLGDGTILSAIKKMSVAYGTAPWKRVMDGDRLKAADDLAGLSPDDAEHLKLSIEAADAVGTPVGPKSIVKLGGRIPVGFNRASNSPPSERMEKIGKLGPHTFYGFKAGQECR